MHFFAANLQPTCYLTVEHYSTTCLWANRKHSKEHCLLNATLLQAVTTVLIWWGFETFTEFFFTVYYCWPRWCSLLIANYFQLTDPHLLQHDWWKQIWQRKWNGRLTQTSARLTPDFSLIWGYFSTDHILICKSIERYSKQCEAKPCQHTCNSSLEHYSTSPFTCCMNVAR